MTTPPAILHIKNDQVTLQPRGESCADVGLVAIRILVHDEDLIRPDEVVLGELFRGEIPDSP